MNLPNDLAFVLLCLCAACIAGCHLPLSPRFPTVVAAFGVVFGVLAALIALLA